MKIKKLRLKNGYKRFHDLTIDLGPSPARIVVLVGPNGGGKSSVLDGIMFHNNAYQPIGSGRQAEIGYHAMHADSPVNFQDISIEFVEGSFYEMREARKKIGRENTLFSFRSPYRYNTDVKITEIKSTAPIEKNGYGANHVASIDSKMEENYRRIQALVQDYMEKHDKAPSVAYAAVLGDLNASISKCLDLELSSIGNIGAGRGTLFFKKPDHKNQFEFNVLSSGEKEVVDILLDLYLRKEQYDDSVFLIDEPELHINTAIQGRLLEEIDRIVGAKCQIWMTTHSIGFLRILQTRMAEKCQIIQFGENLKLASTAQILTPVVSSPAAWRRLFAVALDDLATLVSPRTIIYCEGRDEPTVEGGERGMDAQALNAIFTTKYPDCLFISSGGNTELDKRSAVAISILGKVFSDVKILVLKDRDMVSNARATENDRQMYLQNNPANHRVMKRFELENYLYDKDVLKDYCSRNSLYFDEAKYDALVVDICDQDVKQLTGQIKNICGIRTSISVDKFKINLASHLRAGMSAYDELRSCIFERF